MLRMLGSPRRCCDGVTRRETLAAGTLTALGGFGLPELLRAETLGGVSGRARAKNVIVLYLLGGAATQDMWDLKPNAPREVRGEFQPIDTNVAGIRIGELLPKTARWMHRAAIVRSLNHAAGCHNTLPSYTGLEQLLPDITTTKSSYPPSMGSVCEYLRQAGGVPRDLPDYVYLPCYLGWGQNIRRPGPYCGFLGRRCDPLFTECQPFGDESAPPPLPGQPRVVRGMPFIANSQLPADLTVDRFASRRGLLEQFDSEWRRLETLGSRVDTAGGGSGGSGNGSGAMNLHDRSKRQALSMLVGSQTRAAFDLGSEDSKLVERYGRTLFGHSTLIARRLIESGVRFVNVTWDLFWDRVKVDYDAWDTHTKNFAILRDNKLPHFDQTLTALLEDLDARGLLDETLVLVTSEMGRTPKINGNAGRDHWTHCYSTVFFGGGIRGGTVYGESDAQAAYVKDRPVSTSDVCCTVYQALGIDPGMAVPDPTGRPVPIAHGGQPIREILA
ncbi:MAG: DUF1501 domain-containing protein [Planctomycetota bacterium]